eukprot:Opistho-2@48638
MRSCVLAVCVVAIATCAMLVVADADEGRRIPTARVLVTGFLPFMSYPVNPSGDVARNVSGTCERFALSAAQGGRRVDVCFEGWVLPVNTTGSSRVASALRSSSVDDDAFPYDAILHLGLEDSAKGLKIETMGVNQAADSVMSSRTATPACADNGNSGDVGGTAAVPGAACYLPTTADLGRLELEEAVAYAVDRSADSLGKALDAMILEAWSRDAGTYYCNETLFRTVEAIRSLRRRTRSGRLTPAMFVHLPNYDVMDEAQMARLVKALAAQLGAFSIGM